MTEYTWDHHNRLTQVAVQGAPVAQYTYDVHDRRIGKLAGGVQQWTVYDGDNPYADFSAGGTVTHRYLYGPAVDFLIARLGAAGDTAWYLSDKLGSVRQIADTNGVILNGVIYDSYGQVLSETGMGDRFKYTGREYDTAVDQYFYRARHYGAAIGRFLSEDPIEFRAGDSNLYRYVGNSPTNAIDPSGLDVIYLVDDKPGAGLGHGHAAVLIWAFADFRRLRLQDSPSFSGSGPFRAAGPDQRSRC